jgi:crotonobetainyl-CoA:carnitine CoA-transferase CaiB-like acyl-CoA transferase
MTEALSGLRVVDASNSVAGQFCGRLFADNGAAVVLVEDPDGSKTRRMGPFAPDGCSTLFAHLNQGKASLALGGDRPSRDRLRTLAECADVMIVDSGDKGARMHSGGEGPRTLCKFAPFGPGPMEDWKGSELVYQALSGTMYENGRLEGPPLYGMGRRASYAAGVLGYTQSLATLLGDFGPRVVDVAIAEVAAAMSFNRITQFSYNGEVEGRDIRTIPRALVRCADGWVSIFIYDNRWRHACRGLGLDDLADDPRFASEASRLSNWSAFTAELDRRLASRTADEIVAAGQRERAVVARAMSPLELLAEPQLVARGYWRKRIKPGELLRLGAMFRMSATPQQDHGSAPEIGADGEAVVAGWKRAPVRRAGAAQRPLDGVRVLDLTTAWSGPMCTRILAALGADVVKIEGPGRIDDWRGPIGGGHPARYPNGAAGERPFDRCYQFNTQNHDKRSLVVDLKDPSGLEVALKLADRADVMIANFSAGTLTRMGLGWDVVHVRNSRLIVVEMPAYGGDGPIKDHVALGPSMEMMSGMARSIGYGDGRPTTTGPAYLDPLGGFNASAAVLTALSARERTGRGEYVEIAQREAAMHWIGEEIILAHARGADREPSGNRSDGMAPHDAFPAKGEDAWVAIAAEDDAGFAALAGAMGRPGLASDPRFATFAARKASENALTAIVSEWTRSRDKHETAALLQAAGVLAAPVQDASDLFESAYLRARGLTQSVNHPAAGTNDYLGLPLHISGWDLGIRRAAPTFGQHNSEVLRELGFAPGAIERLEAAGAIAHRPR